MTSISTSPSSSPAGRKNSLCTRIATEADIGEIVRVTNLAFLAEAFCVSGERTDAADILSRFSTGRFYVIDDPEAKIQGRLIASVFGSCENARGYLGLLSVDPAAQGRGLGRVLVNAIEQYCRDGGCNFLDITVVNVRDDLFPFYAGFGFAAIDVLPFPVPERALAPLLLIKMTKPLFPRRELALRLA